MQRRTIMFWLPRLVGIATAVYSVLFVSGALSRLGIYLMTQQHQAAILCGIMALAFLALPSRGGERRGVPWYDMAAILATLVICGYVFFFYRLLAESQLWGITPYEVMMGLVICLIVLEATRRSARLPMVLVALFFILVMFFGNYLPGILHGRGYSLERGMSVLFLGTEGLFGIALNVASLIVFPFIIYGQFIMYSGAGDFFLDLSLALFGRVRGGPAKVAVVSSALFGTLSGATTANVAVTGSVTIPLMKRTGYPPHFAGAVEAAASNGGPIMPPVMGTAAFIMCEWIGISYWSLCVAAFLPAFLYYFGIFMQVDLEAAKLGLKGADLTNLPPKIKIIKEGWHHLLSPIVLVYLLAIAGFPPEVAALYATGVVVIVTSFKKKSRLNLTKIMNALEESTKGMIMVVAACATSGLIIGSVILSGLGFRFAEVVVGIAGGNLLALLMLTAGASFIMGMGLSAIACYIILITLVAPALLKVGVLPMAAHLFVYYWGIVSFITPPVAVGAFVAAGIAQSDPWQTGWTAVRLAIAAFVVPFFFVYNPALLLHGSIGEIAVTVITAVIGITALSFASEGVVLRVGRVSWWLRVLLIGITFTMLFPNYLSYLIGLGLITATVFLQLLVQRKSSQSVS